MSASELVDGRDLADLLAHVSEVLQKDPGEQGLLLAGAALVLMSVRPMFVSGEELRLFLKDIKLKPDTVLEVAYRDAEEQHRVDRWAHPLEVLAGLVGAEPGTGGASDLVGFAVRAPPGSWDELVQERLPWLFSLRHGDQVHICERDGRVRRATVAGVARDAAGRPRIRLKGWAACPALTSIYQPGQVPLQPNPAPDEATPAPADKAREGAPAPAEEEIDPVYVGTAITRPPHVWAYVGAERAAWLRTLKSGDVVHVVTSDLKVYETTVRGVEGFASDEPWVWLHGWGGRIPAPDVYPPGEVVLHSVAHFRGS